MLAEIEADVRGTASWTGRTTLSPRVDAAIEAVPRHEFVRMEDVAVAYRNKPLWIGRGQTISQPYIVAIMTELLDLAAEDVVLEIGTGSGYQTAVLAEIAAQIYSLEVVPEHAETAQKRLTRLGYTTIETRVGDGHDGWPEAAPFDAIIGTAVAERIPKSLTDQLKPGGRLVMPVGPLAGPQMLHRGVKAADGRFASQPLLPVSFVPMVAGRKRP